MISDKDISVIIADDHPMLLRGLYDELIKNKYTVLGQAINGMQALELILTHSPDIALLDIDMPFLTGFEVIKTAKEKGCTTRFIVLSFHRESEYIAQAKSLQIQGYLLKEDPFSEIEKCMSAVLDGSEYFSSSFESVTLISASEELKKLQLLTPSEITILKQITKRLSNQEIADNLFVSIRTVEKHRSNIIHKLELEGGANALISWVLANKNVIAEL